MRLTPAEQRILATVQLQAKVPIERIAKQSGVRSHVARYCIQRMTLEGILHPRPMTNVHRMGFTQYAVYITPHFESTSAKTRLLKMLVESPLTSDIFELAGDYVFGFVLTVRALDDALGFLNMLSGVRGVEIVDKLLSLRIATTVFRRSAFGPHRGGPAHFTYKRGDSPCVLDETDHRILELLHIRPTESLRSLADVARLPHSTLAKRVREMEKSGVILGYVYGISCHRFGMEPFRLMLNVKGFDTNCWQRLFDFAQDHPRINCLFQCLGSWDYELEIEIDERPQLAQVVQEIRELLGSTIVSVRSLPLIAFPKSTGYPYMKAWKPGISTDYTQ